MLPTTPAAKRIAAMMHRKLTTNWSDREVRQYKKLYKAKCFDDPADMELMERYYAFERRRGENGRHRRDLITLLNNWQGELDRATEWNERHPIKAPPRKIIPMVIASEPYVPPSTPEDLAAIERFNELRKLRKQGQQA